MGFRALLTSSSRFLARLPLIVPAALALVVMLPWQDAAPPAAAQGYRGWGMSGMGGGGFFSGRSRSRYMSPMSRGPNSERSGRRGMGPYSSDHSRRGMGPYSSDHSRRGMGPYSPDGSRKGMGPYPPDGSRFGRYPKNDVARWHRRPHYPRPRETSDYPKSSPKTYPKTSKHDPRPSRHPRYPRPRHDDTADTSHPKTGGHYPRPPRHPRHPRYPRRPISTPTDVVVSTPAASGGGAGIVPPGTGKGGGRPPAKSGRRPGTGVPPGDERRYVPNEVVVELASNASNQAINALLRRHRLTRLQSFNLDLTGTSIQRLRINDRRSVPQVVRALEADSFVMAAQPNYISTLQEAGSFPADLEPYAPTRMRLPEAHRVATGDRILIGVVDGGVDNNHPELAGLRITTFDAIGRGDRVHPHGTSIVGAIAARARLRGTAPGAHILAARAFGTSRNSMDGTTASILQAIDWVAQRGARVVNMSFAGPRDPSIQRLLEAAHQRGIVLVAAAGNAGPSSPPLYPAALSGVIAVTATDEDDQIFRAANRGNHVAIAAPGVDLWLPTLDRAYRMTSGTSFAAAEVSGLVALLLERNPRLTPDQIRQILMSTAHDLGPRGVDPQFGAGLIDAYRALMAVTPAAPTPVTAGASPK